MVTEVVFGIEVFWTEPELFDYSKLLESSVSHPPYHTTYISQEGQTC